MDARSAYSLYYTTWFACIAYLNLDRFHGKAVWHSGDCSEQTVRKDKQSLRL